MSLDTFMHINIYLPLVAFGLLSWRTVHAWAAEWAKPDHQWHYRTLLLILNVYVLISTVGTWAREHVNQGGSIVSPILTVQTLGVIAFCVLWQRTTRSRQ